MVTAAGAGVPVLTRAEMPRYLRQNCASNVQYHQCHCKQKSGKYKKLLWMSFNAVHKGIIGWAFPILLAQNSRPRYQSRGREFVLGGIPLINLFADTLKRI